MSKINFTKVEERLQSSLAKMQVDSLNSAAKTIQAVTRPEMRKLAERAIATGERVKLDQKAMIHGFLRTLKEIKDPQFYEQLGITADELEGLLKDPDKLKQPEWQRLQAIRVEMNALKSEIIDKGLDTKNDGTIIKRERHKHINKRFNVRDNWLPLK